MSTKGKTPTPKTQKEIANSLIEPYDTTRGNPNNIGNSTQRANQISFKGDTTKPFSLSLTDTTEAIFYYIKEVIKPTILQNGNIINVPVIYGDGEKWKQIQREGYLKDKEGKIMNPLIVIKRENIENNTSLSNKLDANNPQNLKIFTKNYSPRNAYSNFNVLSNRKEEKQYYAVVIPDYVNITYNVVLSTYYVEQMDRLIEAINYASNSYWGDPQKFKFKAYIDNFQTPVEINNDQERIVRSTFSLKVQGYIIPEVTQKQLASLKKFSNKTQLVFTTEVVDDLK